MSKRDDSFLYSGVTSPERRKAKVQKRKEDKQGKRVKLLPVEEIIFEEIDKERLNVEKQILGFIGVGSDKEKVYETLAALNLYDESLKNLKTKMANIMRRKTKELEDE